MRTFLSIADSALPYDSATSYHVGDVVSSGGVTYISIAATNLNRTPASSPSYWTPIGGGGLGPVSLTGTPSAGQVPTATSSTAATWQTPSGGAASPANQIDITSAPYNASPNGATATTTVGSTAPGTSIVVASAATWKVGHGIYVPGAGVAGAFYLGEVTGISGPTLTVSPATSTTVANGTRVQHDETAAFLAAIAALGGMPGGGIISGPDGVYLVNGPLLDTGGANAVLPMPSIANYSSDNLVLVSIRGSRMTSSVAAGFVIQTAQNSGNFIGGYCGEAGSGFAPFTNVSLDLQDVLLVGPSNPGLTMINAATILNFTHRNLSVQTVDNSVPSNAAGVGICYPEAANNVRLVGEGFNVVSGYYTGIILGEHLNLSTVTIANYVNAILADRGANDGAGGGYQGNTAHIGYVWFGPGPNQIVAGTRKTAIQISAADFESGTNLAINDPLNLIYGLLFFNVPSPGNGYDYAVLPKNGGANLVTIPLWAAPGAFGGNGWTLSNGTTNTTASISQGAAPIVPAGLAALILGGEVGGGGGTGGLISQQLPTYGVPDEKIWDSVISLGVLQFRAANDAYNAASSWLTVTRSGYTPLLARFGAPIAAPLTTPASSSAAGTTGQIAWDANFIYVCTSSNTWKRIALGTF